MKYGSFIKKMADDFTTGWENVYPIHIKDVQHVLSIHKYDQADHDKLKKQRDNCDKSCMSLKNEDCSAAENIVEMSFAQME